MKRSKQHNVILAITFIAGITLIIISIWGFQKSRKFLKYKNTDKGISLKYPRPVAGVPVPVPNSTLIELSSVFAVNKSSLESMFKSNNFIAPTPSLEAGKSDKGS